MAITLMTTTGTIEDVQQALGVTSTPTIRTTDGDPIAASRAEADPTPTETPTTPPVAVSTDTPAVPETAAAADTPAPDPEVPDSEFDEDGEPTTERAARSSHTKLQTIKRLRVRAREAEQRAARLEGENAALRSLGITPATPPSTSPQTPVATTDLPGMPPKPVQDAVDPTTGAPVYETYEDYIIGLTNWVNVCHDLERARRLQQAEHQRRSHQAETTLQERLAAFVKDHPDYNDVIADPALIVSDIQTSILKDPENIHAPAMAYALGKDPALCASIAAMSPLQAAVAMGRLQAQIMSQTNGNGAKKTDPANLAPVSPVPPPPTPVRGLSTPATLSLEESAKRGDYEAFKALRDAEEKRLRSLR